MLPADPRAEIAVLGAVVLRPDTWPELAAIVEVADFTSERIDIARALWRLTEAGTNVDPETLRRALGEVAPACHHDIEAVYSVATAFAATNHARRVRAVAAMRRLVEAAQDVVDRAAQPWALQEPTEFIETASHRLAEASQVREEHQAVHVETIVRDTVRDLEDRKKGKREGITVEWSKLNDLLRGFRPGQFIVIAARPGVGKTAIGLDMCRHMTKHAHTGLLFSLEMDRTELGDRLIAAESGLDTYDIESGRLGADGMDAVIVAAAKLSRCALYIDDSAALPIHTLTARARAAHQRRKLAFVMVDYLQLVRPSRRGHSREAEVAEMSGALKALAKDLHIPVITLAQFNRDADDREPKMSDLRESGAIEQDADKIIALHPIAPTVKPGEPPPKPSNYRPTKVLVLKNRRGPTATVDLTFFARSTTFKDRDP